MTTEERTDATIENLLREDRTFPPPQDFVAVRVAIRVVETLEFVQV